MIPILYESTETAFTSNGICRLRDCLSCIVTEERNGIYECDFEYPVDGTNFNQIYPGRIIAVEHDDTNTIQPFDIIGYEKPINGIVTFHAVHISYRLNGFCTPAVPNNPDGNGKGVWTATYALKRAVNDGGFSSSTDINRTAYLSCLNYEPMICRQMLGGIEGSILDTFGGEYEFDKFNVKLWTSRGSAKNVTIRYGLNMTDYNDELDYSEAYNKCLPFWKGDDKVIDTNPSAVNSGLPSYSGRDVYVPLDLTDQFETQPTNAQMIQYAKNYMIQNQTNLPKQTITVNFVRLQDTEEFKDYSGLWSCRLCDTVRVEFPKYGMSGRYKIVKTVWNVLLDRYDEMELGTLSATLSEAMGVSGGSSGSDTPPSKIYTNGDWRYLTFKDTSSGDSMRLAWCTKTISVANTTASAPYGGYRSASISVAMPSGLFSETPTVAFGTKNGPNSVRLMNVNIASATSLNFYTSSAESITASIKFSFLVIGKA